MAGRRWGAPFFACVAMLLATPSSARVLDDLREKDVPAVERFRFSGQADVAYTDAQPAATPFTFNGAGDTGGISTFSLEAHLFFHAILSPRTKVFVKLHASADDRSRVNVESLAITTKLGYGWPVLEVGRFQSNFGRFPQRFLPMDNPLCGEPLIYTYPTNLPTDQVPQSAADLLTQRGHGDNLQFAGYGSGTSGQSLVSGSWNLNGLKFAGHQEEFSYSLALSNEQAAWSSNFDPNDNKALTLHLGYKPSLPLGFGLSYSHGAYLEHAIGAVPAYKSLHLGDFEANSLGFDFDYAEGPFRFFAEVVYNDWQTPFIPQGLHVTGWFLEPRYKISPELYVALRLEHTHFSEVPVGGTSQPWDFDVGRLELGLGYIIERDLRLKASYQFNRTGGALPDDPEDNLVQAQLVAAF